MFRFNMPGLIIAVAAMAIGMGIESLIGPADIGMVYGGALMLLGDLVYRRRLEVTGGLYDRWVASGSGGFFMLPLWITGTLLMVGPLVVSVIEASQA